MYSRVLLAIDDDESLPAALPVVAAYARRWGANVRVLHVHRIDGPTPDDADRQLVKAAVQRLESAGVSAEGAVRLVRGDRKPRTRSPGRQRRPRRTWSRSVRTAARTWVPCSWAA